jgi:hypothetical protein
MMSISMLLPMSVAEFDVGKQQVFKDSIASVVGAPVSMVMKKKIEPATSHRRRHA